MAREPLRNSPQLFGYILDSVTEHIAVLDDAGYIVYTNRGWTEFGQKNGVPADFDWVGINYLDVCSPGPGENVGNDAVGQKAAQGIWDVIASRRPEFHIEYPCHSPAEKRWFMMNVTRFMHGQETYIVVSHQNITKRKLAEARVIELSRIDELTRIPNRRSFDEFFEREWRRCTRMGTHMSLAMIDIDHFKRLNDSYGHLYGDKCLRRIARLLARHTRRPSDHCARYGGEEFTFILGDTDLEPARQIMQEICDSIASLKLPKTYSGERPSVTASVGLITAQAKHKISTKEMIEKADALLYQAKDNGRNQICSAKA